MDGEGRALGGSCDDDAGAISGARTTRDENVAPNRGYGRPGHVDRRERHPLDELHLRARGRVTNGLDRTTDAAL